MSKKVKWIVIGVILVSIIIVFNSGSSDFKSGWEKGQKKTTQKQEKEQTYNPELQKKRMAFIKKMGEQGYFIKIIIENGRGKLFITDKFLLLATQDKNDLLEVPYAYVYDELQASPLFAPPLQVRRGLLIIGLYDPFKGLKP